MEYPIKEFTLEVTNACNFRCEFCPYEDMTRERGRMDFDLACRLIDEVAEKRLARIAGVEIMGEPMLYPRLFDLMSHAHNRNLPMFLITNGSMLDETTIPRLLDGPLETLQISYQTPDEKTFALRGANASFPEYRERIRSLVRYRLRHDSPTEVCILLLCTMHNPFRSPRVLDSFKSILKEVEDWISFVESEGGRVDRNRILTDLRNYRKDAFLSTADTRLFITHEISMRILLFQRWGPWIMDKNRVRVTPSPRGSCSVPNEQFHVLWDGRVTYCCYDFNGELAVGDLNTMSIEEALNGPIAEIRAAFRRNEIPAEFCRRCRGSLSTLDFARALSFGACLRLLSDRDMLTLFLRRSKNTGLLWKWIPFLGSKS